MILGVGADAGFRKIIESTAVGICGRRASSSRKRASLICTSVSRQSQTMIEVSFKYEITKIWRLTCGLNCSFESNWLYSRLKLNVRPQTLLIHLAYMYSSYLVNQSLSRGKKKKLSASPSFSASAPSVAELSAFHSSPTLAPSSFPGAYLVCWFCLLFFIPNQSINLKKISYSGSLSFSRCVPSVLVLLFL